MRRLATALLLLGTTAAAEEALTPQSFEARSEGRTLHFTLQGLPFGAEQYFPGRRVLWRFSDGRCQQGRWWDEGTRICFAYEKDDGTQCWTFHPRPGGFAAALVENGAETGFVLELAGSDRTPLDCPGPYVGSDAAPLLGGTSEHG
jgi:hypothetical protein